MKKVLSLILALSMMLGVVSFASAEEALPTFDKIVLGENTDLPITAQTWAAKTENWPAMSRSSMKPIRTSRSSMS